ncbi:hypothetical protein EVAR_60452_1 [Eumeta japonica]|uniref:Uncharacterized protein n=1 Tax=Eumeta variegata TaxID=151549 RepID=A0A4C1Z4D7_EUMVA|nr:hypothetical protein EVAR_60452_1 [Eumeta japonica]
MRRIVIESRIAIVIENETSNGHGKWLADLFHSRAAPRTIELISRCYRLREPESLSEELLFFYPIIGHGVFAALWPTRGVIALCLNYSRNATCNVTNTSRS